MLVHGVCCQYLECQGFLVDVFPIFIPSILVFVLDFKCRDKFSFKAVPSKSQWFKSNSLFWRTCFYRQQVNQTPSLFVVLDCKDNDTFIRNLYIQQSYFQCKLMLVILDILNQHFQFIIYNIEQQFLKYYHVFVLNAHLCWQIKII